MKTRLIYLQSGFWNKVRKDSSIEGLRTLLELYDIFSKSDICSDMNIEEWKNDEFLMLLIKKFVSGGNIELEFNSKAKIESTLNSADENIEDLSAVYMLNESKLMCDGYGIQKGILAINPDNLSYRKDLFKGQSFSLNKGEKYNNSYLFFKNELEHTCNSMIIIDPYILTKPQLFDAGLFPLLDSTLPQKLTNIPFHLSIFSQIGDKNNGDGKLIYSKLENYLSKIRPQLSVNLSIYRVGIGNGFHSRHIITNNVLIDSEDGFDLFDDKGKSTKNATITKIYPRFFGDDRGDMNKYLSWISITKKHALNSQSSESSSYQTRWGEVDNRLFEMV